MDVVDNIVAVDGSAAVPPPADIVAFTPIRIDGNSVNTFIDRKTGEYPR